MMVSLEIPALEKLYNAVHRSDDHDHPITPRIFTAILQENNSITVKMVAGLIMTYNHPHRYPLLLHRPGH